MTREEDLEHVKSTIKRLEESKDADCRYLAKVMRLMLTPGISSETRDAIMELGRDVIALKSREVRDRLDREHDKKIVRNYEKVLRWNYITVIFAGIAVVVALISKLWSW
jgi:hypothetical protein